MNSFAFAFEAIFKHCDLGQVLNSFVVVVVVVASSTTTGLLLLLKCHSKQLPRDCHQGRETMSWEKKLRVYKSPVLVYLHFMRFYHSKVVFQSFY